MIVLPIDQHDARWVRHLRDRLDVFQSPGYGVNPERHDASRILIRGIKKLPRGVDRKIPRALPSCWFVTYQQQPSSSLVDCKNCQIVVPAVRHIQKIAGGMHMNVGCQIFHRRERGQRGACL